MSHQSGQDSSAALPLRNYTRLTFGELSDAILSLTAHELHQLSGYECVHGQREPVLALLRARLTELGTGIAPSGTPTLFIPEQAASPENLPVMPGVEARAVEVRATDTSAEGTEQGRPAW